MLLTIFILVILAICIVNRISWQRVIVAMACNSLFNCAPFIVPLIHVGRRDRTIADLCLIIYNLIVYAILDIHICWCRLCVIITLNTMQVRLINLLLNLKIFIQITAIVLPPIVMKVIEPVPQAWVRTNWHMLQLHFKNILLFFASFKFALYSSFIPFYCWCVRFKFSSLAAGKLSL